MLGVFGLFESWAHIAWLFPSPRTPVLDSLNFEDDFHPCGGSTKEGKCFQCLEALSIL